MSSCANCSTVDPIEDTGAILLLPGKDSLSEKLQLLFSREGITYNVSKDLYSLTYSTKEDLLSILNLMKQNVADLDPNDLKMGIKRGEASALHPPRLSTFSQFLALFANHDLVTIIRDARFTSHMQPIVDLHSKETFGYEFVIRPSEIGKPFKPFELFQAAQETGLHSFLDREARISAIKTSAALLPNGIKRFINFLPSSIYNPNYCLSHTFEAVEKYDLQPSDFVFEVVETERIPDINHLTSIFTVYKREGMKVALDDVGSGFATVDVLAKLQPDVVKIDRNLISYCDTQPSQQQKIMEILNVSNSFGAVTLAEGIERKEEYAFISSLGIDLAQGYLFGKPKASPQQIDWHPIAAS